MVTVCTWLIVEKSLENHNLNASEVVSTGVDYTMGIIGRRSHYRKKNDFKKTIYKLYINHFELVYLFC